MDKIMIYWKSLTTKGKSKMLLNCFLLISAVFMTCFLVYVFVIVQSSQTKPEDSVARYFKIYLKKFGKKYKGEEFKERLENFKNSVKEIEYLNRPYKEPRFGLTKFSDMSRKEFENTMLMQGAQAQPECRVIDKPCDFISTDENVDKKHGQHSKIPARVDLRERGVVGPVLSQENCLNCWAFGVIGVMESMLLISNQTQRYQRLSIQELTDCSTYTNKCHMSSIAKAVDWMCNRHWPIIPESEYPLTLKEQNCTIEKPKEGALVKRYQVKCNATPSEIAEIIATHGPVAATVNSRPWMNYLGGVIQFHCRGDQSNHVVQIVGYDNTAPEPYFILRNSWGKDFGDNGYVYVSMGNFMCAVGRQITYFDAFYYKS